jgi:hypothetical protein
MARDIRNDNNAVIDLDNYLVSLNTFLRKSHESANLPLQGGFVADVANVWGLA